MKIAIYAADAHGYYPEEACGRNYTFQPHNGKVHTRLGTNLVTGSIDPSELLGEVSVPDGSTLEETKCGDLALFLPGETEGYSASAVWNLATVHRDGARVLTP
jgi:hypothetical protein